MIKKTAPDVKGNVSKIEGELPSNWVHEYETPYDPELDGEEIEEEFAGIEGVRYVGTENVSGGMPQYRVEVHLDRLDTIETDAYQEVLRQTS